MKIRAVTLISISCVHGLSLSSCSSLNNSGASAPTFGECKVTGKQGSIKLNTADPKTLTVATVLPSNGWWNGQSPSTINGGYEYCLMANIAYRAGLNSITVQNQSWDQLISASNTKYDVAAAAITITEPRKKVFNFSTPYFQSNLGVAVKKGAKINKTNLASKKIGVLQGNMGAQYANDELRPAGGVQQFQSETEMFTALRAEQIDAVVTDTTLALSNTAASNGDLVVIGQIQANQDYGLITPKDGLNIEGFNEAIEDMRSDGTLDDLSDAWLKPLFGINPNDIPVWK